MISKLLFEFVGERLTKLPPLIYFRELLRSNFLDYILLRLENVLELKA